MIQTKFVRIVKYVITNLFLRSNSVLKVAREVSEDATEQPKDDSDVQYDHTDDDEVETLSSAQTMVSYKNDTNRIPISRNRMFRYWDNCEN